MNFKLADVKNDYDLLLITKEDSSRFIKSIEFNDEKYSFIISDVKTTISNKLFTRETNEYLFTLNIVDKKCTYLLKEKNMSFDIDVEKVEFLRRRRQTKLVYKIASDEEEFELIIEELEGELNE